MTGVRPYLRLVKPKRQAARSPSQFELIQEPLLPVRDRTLCICAADALDEAFLYQLTETLRPSSIVDLRTAPRFDFGSLDRRKALYLFESIGAQYRDVGDSLPPRTHRGSSDTVGISDALSRLEVATSSNMLLALTDAGADIETAGISAIQYLRKLTGHTWELMLFGTVKKEATEESNISRQVLFISHANPEDNEFVLWLQSQLTRLGYETWSDLTQLKAGEVFWDTIEDLIRRRAIRVIAVVSRIALTKPGVLDEISLAVSVERTQRLSGFVIPVRLDDIPFSDFRANIARKNTLDFSEGWAVGLSKLVDTLTRDRVPRPRQNEGLSLADWWAQQKAPILSISEATETLISNRFQVTLLPRRVYSYFKDTSLSHKASRHLVPFKENMLSFLSKAELVRQGLVSVEQHSILSADDLFSGNLSMTSHLAHYQRRQLFHRMLNGLWESFLLARGLGEFTQTGARPTPFIPDGLLSNNTASFIDEQGKKRRRNLVGYSDKRGLYWHLAPVGSFSTTSETFLNLRLRVLFSENGCDQWPSVDRMRTTRRSFCKNWWNDKWRSLQTALMAYLANGTDQVQVWSGDCGSLLLCTTPLSYESPLTIVEPNVKHSEGAMDDDADDYFDEDVDDWNDLGD